MDQVKRMVASWGRAFLAASLATYTIQGLDLRAMVASGIAALVPMLLRYINPNDKSFGIGS